MLPTLVHGFDGLTASISNRRPVRLRSRSVLRETAQDKPTPAVAPISRAGRLASRLTCVFQHHSQVLANAASYRGTL